MVGVGPISLVALAVIGTAFIWKGSLWLEHAADRLAAGYGLPRIVQGTIVAAAGSSMPELATVLLATLLHGEFGLGVGAIVGSAVFNILVIPSLAAVLGGSMTTTRELVYKEALFYMLAVAALLLTFSVAVIYNPGGEGLQGTVTRPLALFPLGLYMLYLFTQYLDTADHDVEEAADVDFPRTWLWFGLGLVLIIVGVEALVRAAIRLGTLFDTPTFLWGLVVVAAGSSLPDAFVSVAAARADRPTVSLANVLGSNVFDLLVAVPVGILMAGALTVDFEHVVPMMGFLILSTVAFFGVARTDMLLSRGEAWGLLVLYGLFVVWLLLESVGVMNVIAT